LKNNAKSATPRAFSVGNAESHMHATRKKDREKKEQSTKHYERTTVRT